jgi:hypothetical protein
MSLSIMRFRAGASGYAIAAGCVERVGPARAGVPHLARVIEGGAGAGEAGARTLRISAKGRAIDVTVGGPVDVVEIDVGHVTPCPPALAANVLGFARIDDEMYALLDAERLVVAVASELMMNPPDLNPVSLP